MKGKVGLICGVVNQHSIAWAVAQSWRAAGCDVRTPITVSRDHSLMNCANLEPYTVATADGHCAWSEQVVLSYQDERARAKVERLVAAEWGEEAAAGCALMHFSALL